jgi:hypothetical protein
MYSSKSIITLTAIAGLSAVFGSTTSLASDASTKLTMKPLAGLSFDVGSKRAVSYFTSENGKCKVVVTMADEPDWDEEVPSLTSTRFEAAVPGGKAARLRLGDGGAIDFRCALGAETMSVHGAKQLASGDLR